MSGGPRILVIGAGAAGSACAGLLTSAGAEVTVVDKGGNPGGRLATRRARVRTEHGWTVVEHDHGCAGFVIGDPRLGGVVDHLNHWGQVAPWRPRTRQADGVGEAEEQLVGLPRNNATFSFLLGRDYQRGVKVEAIERLGDRWIARTRADRSLGPAKAVVLALPAPQAVPLLTALPELQISARRAEYYPSWTVMLSLKSRPDVAFERWLNPRPEISHVLENSSKPGREHARELSNWVVHASRSWSQVHLEDSNEAVLSVLGPLACRLLRVSPDAVAHVAAHRWRYARVKDTSPGPGYFWNSEERVGLCGDWCVGDGVEAAVLSGRRLARQVIAQLIQGTEAPLMAPSLPREVGGH